jgi:hypothetical protein
MEINRRLALAIGYAPWDILVQSSSVMVFRELEFCEFDHQDWRTIGPIMDRYKMFPFWSDGAEAFEIRPGGVMTILEGCPKTCAAMAVIAAHERGLL